MVLSCLNCVLRRCQFGFIEGLGFQQGVFFLLHLALKDTDLVMVVILVFAVGVDKL